MILRGVSIRFVDLRYDEKSKVTYTKLNFTAAFSNPVREAMEWADLPDGFSSAKLDGDLTASHLILTPDDKALKQHEIQLDIQSASNFEVHRVKSGEDSTETELRFQVVTSQDGAEAIAGAYLRAIGKSGASLRINYEQQEALPIEVSKQDRLISEEQAHDPSEETDEPGDDGTALAPAVLAGGTHQRKDRASRKGSGTVN